MAGTIRSTGMGGLFCEGNAWHYTWSVFHDVQGLIDLFGSDEKFTTKIDSVFTIPNIIKPALMVELFMK